MDATMVNTVLGPVSSEELGITLVHEHIVYGYPGWEGDLSIISLDHDAIVNTGLGVFEKLKPHGVKTFVDATAIDGGRMPDIYQEISEKSGMNIICSTGYYYEGEGAAAHYKVRQVLGGDIVSELAELFIKEINVGIRGSGIKAGVIKVGSSKGQITDYEKCLFKAAALAQEETGVPIITHTQMGTMGPDQAELLVSEGADPKRIQIGHMSDNTDIRYHLQTLKHGVYVALDRMGVQGILGCPMEIEKYGVISGLIGIGHVDKIMLSHDFVAHMLGRPMVFPKSLEPLLAKWYPTHLFENVIPALKKGGVTEDQVKTIIEDNPRRLFEGK